MSVDLFSMPNRLGAGAVGDESITDLGLPSAIHLHPIHGQQGRLHLHDLTG